LVIDLRAIFANLSRPLHRTFFIAGVNARRVKLRAHVIFEGVVQGVFFRANAQRHADSLGLTGWVRNRQDGSVEAVFEGEEAAVQEAIEWCAERQPYAKVTRKTVKTAEATGEFTRFSIR